MKKNPQQQFMESKAKDMDKFSRSNSQTKKENIYKMHEESMKNLKSGDIGEMYSDANKYRAQSTSSDIKTRTKFSKRF